MSLSEIPRIHDPESEIQGAVSGSDERWLIPTLLHQFLEPADEAVEVIDDRKDC